MSERIRIYRKSTNESPPKLTKGELTNVLARIESLARVQRPSLLALFIPAKSGARSAFHKLPALSSQLIDNKALRVLDYSDSGIEVEQDSLGRSGEVTKGTRDSINLWIRQHVISNGLANENEVSVVIE